MKKTTTIRVAEATQGQIKDLSKFGGISDVIAVAVDRLWQVEAPKVNTQGQSSHEVIPKTP